MIKIAIIDDEAKDIERLLGYVAEFEKAEKIGVEVDRYENGADFLTEYKPVYTVVFIDIDMPILDGLETAKRLRKIDSQVPLVYITNMAQFAVKGYEVDALDFIVKPVGYFNFATKIKKAMKIQKSYEREKVVIESDKKYYCLYAADIYYIEVFQHDLIYHTSIGDITTKGSMKERAKYFESKHFIRINHCFLVNLYNLIEFKGSSVRLKNGEEIPVSQSKRKAVKQAVIEYFKCISDGGGGEI